MVIKRICSLNLKKKQQLRYLKGITEEIHYLVSQESLSQEEQVLLTRVTNYLSRSITTPYRDFYLEFWEIAKMAPWLFDKCYAYESSKRKAYIWESMTSSLPSKHEILQCANCLSSVCKEVKRPKR